MRKFHLYDGYKTKDLLHYGLDHLASSITLLETNPRLYDSAGYLAHIGIELYLKAMMLHDIGYFVDEHKFAMLLTKKNMPKSFFNISKANIETYDRLDQFAELRYPRLDTSFEIGSEDANKIKYLCDEIHDCFPSALKAEINAIDHTEKGNRILMQKKKD